MRRVFHEQLVVVREFRRHLASTDNDDGDNDDDGDDVKVETLAKTNYRHQMGSKKRKERTQKGNELSRAVQDIDVLLELIDNRKAEIQDLEDSVQATSRKVRISAMFLPDRITDY